MSTVSKSFTAVGVSDVLSLQPGTSLSYDVSGTFSGTVLIEKSDSPNTHWNAIAGKSFTAAASGTIKNETPGPLFYRFRCSVYASGTIVTSLADVSDSQPAETGPSGSGGFTVTDSGITTPQLTTPDLQATDGQYGGNIEIIKSRVLADGTGSYQPIAADLTIEDDAGSDDGTDPAFLAPVMGNVLGDAPAGEGNYMAGVIGANSVQDNSGSDYPKAGVLGILMDGSKGARAIVQAHMDGSDPSAETNAESAFGVSMMNNHADSKVDYGLDLYEPGSAHISSCPAFRISKANIRMTNEICVLEGAGAPVNGTTGDDFAAKGSLYIDRTNGWLYQNIGTKADPVWTMIGGPGVQRTIRMRFSAAEVNAGASLLAAVPGYRYRMTDGKAIAIGGAAGSVTTVDILGTVSTPRKLIAFGQAALTQSALVRAGSSGGVILADGASFTQNDANTAITIGKTGSDLDTATHIDVIFDYVLEP